MQSDKKSNPAVASPSVSQSKKNFLAAIYEPIRADLAEVDRLLVDELNRDVPWMESLLNHTNIAGGKRMRPALVLFSGLCCGEINPQHRYLGAALEMIHTASLVHDDVLDHAEQRRHVATVNSRWDNKTSVLLGDYLFTHAFHIGGKSDSMVALKRLSIASNRVCEGEMRQNAWSGDFEITESSYLDMVGQKTAELCSCACYCGSHFSGADEATAVGFDAFGQNLGIAFQIVDDILDLVGDDQTVCKTLGTDLKNRKPTLPIIHSLSQAVPALRQEMVKVLESDEPDSQQVMDWLDASGSLDYANAVARGYAQKASEFAANLSAGEGSRALKVMAEFVLERTF